jgi:hypothetical protein
MAVGGQRLTESPAPGLEKPKKLTAAEWGQLKAAHAPPWSDQMWRRACAILNIRSTSD